MASLTEGPDVPQGAESVCLTVPAASEPGEVPCCYDADVNVIRSHFNVESCILTVSLKR